MLLFLLIEITGMTSQPGSLRSTLRCARYAITYHYSKRLGSSNEKICPIIQRMLCGGINPSNQISQFAAAYVATNAGAINSVLPATNSSYAVNREAVQVAGGVLHFLHITGDDGNPYTVTLLERPAPNHSGVIIEAAAGHHNLAHGYGNIVHQEHPHYQQQ